MCDGITFFTGHLPACQVTRCSTSSNPVPIGVSEDSEHITYGASCQAACAIGFKSANNTESNSVPRYPVCGENKCVDVAASDSSMLAPDCPDLTSGDRCKVMRATDYTGGASPLTCTLDVVNGSGSLIGILPNCSVSSCAVDGIPSDMSHLCDGIVFLESRYANTSSIWSCGSNGCLVRDTTPFYPVGKALSCPSTALLDDDTMEGLDCFLTLGETCFLASDTTSFCSFGRVLSFPSSCAPRRHRGGLGLLLFGLG